jgi:DNA-binding response OmpR family regulator
MHSFTEYCDHVLGPAAADEVVQLLDRTTTNKTDFFREPQHFELLVRVALPALRRAGAGERRPLRVWSAGCSTGEEPYTLAMVLAGEAERRPLRFEILASDLCTRVLRRAEAGTPDQPLVIGSLTVDRRARTARLDGRLLDLRPREFELLAFLASRPGAVVSRREIMAEVWHLPYGGADKTVDVHVSWLRRKLGESAVNPRFIQTVRNVGIKLVEPAAD